MKREIVCADTAQWIKGIEIMDAVVTSMPDHEETPMSLSEWRDWWVGMAREVMRKTRTYSIFYSTDRKVEGWLMSRCALLFEAARLEEIPCRWHKIALRRDEGKVDLFRPTYTHLICFSRKGKSGKATPDVFSRGKTLYPNGMGLSACKVAIQFIKDNSDATTVFDPFCGLGSVPAIANMMGLDSVGVEIREDFCAKARALNVTMQ